MCCFKFPFQRYTLPQRGHSKRPGDLVLRRSAARASTGWSEGCNTGCGDAWATGWAVMPSGRGGKLPNWAMRRWLLWWTWFAWLAHSAIIRSLSLPQWLKQQFINEVLLCAQPGCCSWGCSCAWSDVSRGGEGWLLSALQFDVLQEVAPLAVYSSTGFTGILACRTSLLPHVTPAGDPRGVDLLGHTNYTRSVRCLRQDTPAK